MARPVRPPILPLDPDARLVSRTSGMTGRGGMFRTLFLTGGSTKAVRLATLIGLGAMAGMLWAATNNQPTLMAWLSFGAYLTPFVQVWSAYRRSRPDQGSRWPRFTIRRVMVASGMVAGYLGILRALFTTYPMPDLRLNLMLSVSILLIYAMFCGLGCYVWVSVANVRAVLRGERPRDYGRESRPSSPGAEGEGGP